jgi:hypothetical protein
MSDEMLKLADQIEGAKRLACYNPADRELESDFTFSDAECKLIASAIRAAAASAEPVAWRTRWKTGSKRDREWEMWSYHTEHPTVADTRIIEPLYTHPAPDAEIVAANLEQVITRAILAHERLLSGSVGAISQGEANRAARKAKDIAAALARAKGSSQPEPCPACDHVHPRGARCIGVAVGAGGGVVKLKETRGHE